MAYGYLDLAYLIEISVVFNLAYREIKHGFVLEKMKKIREEISKDEELQERIKKIKKDTSLGSDVVESDYNKLVAIIECDSNAKDCADINTDLCKAWDHDKRYCKYFVKTILTGRGLFQVNTSIVVALIILLFATIFPHIGIDFNPFIWWILFSMLCVTIVVPIRLLYMSEKTGNMLTGKNGQKGLIEKLEDAFNSHYNKHLLDESGEGYL
ncbi:MAG: hypothetical protein H0A76_07990 [Candidatus Thiodubiliella endoseptemdiera]|uniref:Uncharacterized protein n=1 Tax=Candidatus Thiodubiliella endoseptemdiera TaxID=2738886 RepID=A0A853F2Q4_9GAMM|nr:hypothetical protein [Candidatus Thiodubiliella endoseptemdiera]